MRRSVQFAVRAWARLPVPLGPAAAVLSYHRVNPVRDSLAVTPRTFRRQMAYLAEQQALRPALRLDHVLDSFAAGSAPHRAVIVTFDDGWADNHDYALSALVEHAIPAIVYVPSRLLGTRNVLSATQLREMVAAGIEVGSHTRSHADLRLCSGAEIEREVRGSREDLEDLLGCPVTSFAYPFGSYRRAAELAVAAAGYRSALTCRRGWLQPSSDFLHIRRNFVREVDDATFAAAARGGLTVLRPAQVLRGLKMSLPRST